MTDQQQKSQQPLRAGTPAPDFTLKSTPDQTVSLHEFRGRPVILTFYPADFSEVCSDQMSLYSQIMPEFSKYNAEILGISVDGPWAHKAFREQRHIKFFLLSDFEPKGEVGRAYGVYNAKTGEEKRALFVIDEDGMIRWSYLSPSGVNPGADGILNALEEMQKQEEHQNG
jgi:peroxiredoxin